MLIYKALNGDAGLAEHQELKGLLDVGSEFITHRDDASEVRRSGEFVEMRRFSSNEKIRLCVFFELADAFAIDVSTESMRVLGDDEDRLGNYKPFKRTFMFEALIDEQMFESRVAVAPGFKQRFRVPRYTKVEERLNNVEQTTQSGRARVWHLGDGEHLLVVREQFDVADPRYFMGVNRPGLSTRRTRVSRVEQVKVEVQTGKVKEVLLGVETFSGLGFDPSGRSVSILATDSTPLYDAGNVYVARIGHLWGRYTNSGFRMDPSASYAVAEPAWHPDQFLSLVTVHGTEADALDPQTSILKQLTCTHTTKRGIERSTIEFPSHPDPNYIWSAVEVDLLRTAPAALLLRVRLGAVRSPSASGTTVTGASLGAFFWSSDSGASWVYLDLSSIAMLHGRYHVERSMIAVGDKDGSALLVTSESGLASDLNDGMIAIHRITKDGATTLGEIKGETFSEGLYAGVGVGEQTLFPKYWPVANGGGVRVKVDGEMKPLLWIQFDPFFTSPRVERNGLPDPKMLEYPGTNAMLMVSIDVGVTWERRALPTIWPHHVGFVVALDESTLAVPVISKRVSEDGGWPPARVQIYTSKDGAKTWKKTADKFQLSALAFVDGRMNMDSDQFHIADFRSDYNRGELFTLVPMHDRNGEVQAINPGRPWISDSRKKAPSDGQ